MEGLNFECEQHPGEKVCFFCATNQWHFVPLCPQCLPAHTQNHPKATKVNIESVAAVWDKHVAQRDNAIAQYDSALQRVKEEKQSKRVPKQIAQLEACREKIIQIVNNHFDMLIARIEKKASATIQYQSQLLSKLEKNLEADISEIRGICEIKSPTQWAEQAKRIYFKDSVQTYVEEIDELLKQHQERVYEQKDIEFAPFHSTEESVKKFLDTRVWEIKEKPKQPEKQVKKEGKKTSKIVNKPKICKVCGGQLKYLTEWKKHLVCPTCGGKERNYIPKPK